jgi:hypothetical protein
VTFIPFEGRIAEIYCRQIPGFRLVKGQHAEDKHESESGPLGSVLGYFVLILVVLAFFRDKFEQQPHAEFRFIGCRQHFLLDDAKTYKRAGLEQVRSDHVRGAPAVRRRPAGAAWFQG